MAEPVKFRGVVTFQRYYSEETFWGVYNVKTHERLPYAKDYNPPGIFEDDEDFDKQTFIVCVAGKMQLLYVGSEYEFTATCEYSSKYNTYNYVPITITAIAPSSVEDSRFFLEAILTEKQADTLLKTYPNIIQEIIDGKDNVDVSQLNGIGEKSYRKIRQRIIDNYVISDIISLLQPYGVTYTAIKNLLKWEPNSSILKQKIKDNPYCLTEARGFGFKTVDKLALKLDPSLIDSGKRLIAFMRYYLTAAAENEGHTWVEITALKSGISDQIHQCSELFDKLIGLEKDGAFAGFFYIQDNKIGLLRYRNCENNIYDILTGLENYNFAGVIDTEKGISKAEKELEYELSEDQKAIVRQVKNNNVIVFTGKAGSGKTSSAKAILNSFPYSGIACCSLSAKAAQRIQEATGFKAMTIHRLLEFKAGEFTKDANNRLDYDVIFLDEASMVNCVLFYHLVSAIKEGAKLIICGDYAQLPPIGAGNVFADILNMDDIFNVSILKKVHRQAETSGILTDANKIRDGIYPIGEPKPQIISGELKDMAYVFRDDANRIQNIVVDQFLKIKEKHGIDSVAIAIPRKDTVVNSALEINKRIQAKLIDTDVVDYIQGIGNKFYIGDRILQTENDGARDIYNGEVGFVREVYPNAKPDEVCMVAVFKSTLSGQDKVISYDREELASVLLGYAMSVHRLQGSEYDYIITALDTTHYILLDRCMLYTAITRAKKMCILVAQPDAFNRAMKINKVNNRQTWLSLKYKENKVAV